jgi:hypothetical protein
MTSCPAFAAALREERVLAEQRLREALLRQDESAALDAGTRLADLAEITRRNAWEPVSLLAP